MIVTTGFNPNTKDNAGNMPLHIAYKNGNTEIFYQIFYSSYCGVATILNLLQSFECQPALLSALGNSIYLKQDEDGNSLLHLICMNNNIRLARLVSRTKCNPNMLNKNGDTPLHIVCRNGNVDIAAILLSMEQCDVNVLNKDDDTPLHLACRNGFSAIVEAFIEKET